jgi:hypothetical protein
MDIAIEVPRNKTHNQTTMCVFTGMAAVFHRADGVS